MNIQHRSHEEDMYIIEIKDSSGQLKAIDLRRKVH